MRMPLYRAVLMRGVSHRAMVTRLAHGFDPRVTVFARAPEIKGGFFDDESEVSDAA